VVELSHDSRPIIGRGPPLGATFLTLALLSIALMVADQRYPQIQRVRSWLTAIAFPVQKGVDLPFRAWNWLGESFADRNRLRAENLELTGRLRLANLQLQRFAVLEEENRRLRDMRENSAGIAERVLVASILNVDLDPFRHRVLLANHPSPLSARRGPMPFIGCGHFRAAAEFLQRADPSRAPIDWSG